MGLPRFAEDLPVRSSTFLLSVCRMNFHRGLASAPVRRNGNKNLYVLPGKLNKARPLIHKSPTWLTHPRPRAILLAGPCALAVLAPDQLIAGDNQVSRKVAKYAKSAETD
jgi:hypothetical protein